MLKEKLAKRHLKKAFHKQDGSSLEPVVIVGPSDIEFHFWDPQDPPYPVDWDYSQYGGPQIFYREPGGGVYSNPVEIDFDEEEEKAMFKASQEYKRTINQTIPSKIVNAMRDMKDDSIEKLLKINVGATILVLMAVAYMVM